MPNYFDPATNKSFRNKFLQFKRKFIICPEQWNMLTGKYSNYNWQNIKFNKANKNLLNEIEGIYFFTANPKIVNADFINYLLYIGETDNLKRRFNDYLRKKDSPKSGQFKVYTIIDDYPENLYFHFVELSGANQVRRRKIENDLLLAFTPPINSKYPQGFQSIILAAYQQ